MLVVNLILLYLPVCSNAAHLSSVQYKSALHSYQRKIHRNIA